MQLEYFTLGEYAGLLKHLAKAVKNGEPDALDAAAHALIQILPQDALIVPIPSHSGQQTYNLKICNIIARYYGLRVLDCLGGQPHESLCVIKNREYQQGLAKGSLLPSPEELNIELRFPVIIKKRLCLIDNVIASGTTAMAAARLFHNAALYCIASDETYPKIPGVISGMFHH